MNFERPIIEDAVMTSPGVPNQQPVLPSFRTARQTRSNTLHQQGMSQNAEENKEDI